MIDLIKSELQNKLPGRVAQYKMAPSDRAIRDQALNLKEIKKSAVLVLLFYKNNELHLLLTQRANYNGAHGGQISFPGGKFEAGKDTNLLDTAIRETEEEIFLKKDSFKILGKLSSLNIPISKICVQPYIAFSSDISHAKSDRYEVTDLYEVSISSLQNPENIKWKDNNELKYPYYDFNKKIIWGATAMMISELLEIINRLKQN